ncbi:hypothetical protein [Cohnella yongneupensis]|uniref:Uncharacterized protein n=1 Tax=Cohnella yongneupensis TaxID=425006 RepID=A0ABW0R1N1_9BACL
MNKRKTTLLAATLSVALIGAFSWYQSAEADSSSNPGSTNDPIVTKSYVDKSIAEQVQIELQKQLAAGVGGGEASSSSKLEVVTVPLGSKIIVADGGELIVRTGKAIAYSADANGLSDMTDGIDIAPGKPIKTNHLILFPRGGRGVEADPKQAKGLIVLVRGGYQLQ